MTVSAPVVGGQARSLGQWTERRLRLAILTGELGPGTRLAPALLAREWGISVTPLREAVHRLAGEGLIEESRHRGSHVSMVSAEDARDLYELRLLLEPLALEKSLGATDEGHRSAMQGAFDRWVQATEDDRLDVLATEEVHQAFHSVLYERCPSVRLLNTVDMLSRHSARYRILAGSTGRGGADVAWAEHKGILDACLAGDVTLAMSKLAGHLELTRDYVADYVGGRDRAQTV